MSSMPAPPAIISPSRFVRYALRNRMSGLTAFDNVLLCFDPGTYAKLKRQHPGRAFRGLTGELWLLDHNVAIAGNLGIGGPAAVAFLEELTACGIRRFVTLGSAGALHPGCRLADVVLCSAALSDEGTSAHYPGFQCLSRPARTLTSRVARWLREGNISFQQGKAWTTDAPYRETTAKLERFLAAGADVVEMEASAIFNVAHFRKVSLASVFIISDSIAKGQWKPAFDSTQVQKTSLLVANELVRFLSTRSARA